MIRGRVDLEGLGWIEYDESGAGGVRIGDRLLPPEIEVHFPSDRESPSLDMRLAVVDGVPQCREVVIRAKEGGREVRTSDFRAVTLESWIEDLYAIVAKRVTAEDERGMTAVLESNPDRVREASKVVQRARAASRRTITHSLLEEVAMVYRAHADARPTQSVAAAFGVAHRTAAKYVQLAEKAGLLSSTTPGKRRS